VYINNPPEGFNNLWLCMVGISADGTHPPPDPVFWVPLAPSLGVVNALNGASGSASLTSSDNSITISGGGSSGAPIDLVVPSVSTSLVWEGQSAPATGQTRLTSFDGTIQFAGDGGANSSVNLSSRKLNLQRVLDAGVYANDDTAPVLAPATLASIFTSSAGSVGGFSGNWLGTAPPAPLVQNPYVLPGSVYQLCGLLNVVVSECGEGMFANLALRINGVANESAQGLLISGSPSIYQIVDAPAPVNGRSTEIGSFYVPVNVIFTGPASNSPDGEKLGLNAYCESTMEGSVLSMAVQWVDSFTLTELYASELPGAPLAQRVVSRSAPAPMAVKAKALPKKK
jgi:hypothetical protein